MNDTELLKRIELLDKMTLNSDNHHMYVGFGYNKSTEDIKNAGVKNAKMIVPLYKTCDQFKNKSLIKLNNYYESVNSSKSSEHLNSITKTSYIDILIYVDTEQSDVIIAEINKANTLYIFFVTEDSAKKDQAKFSKCKTFLNIFKCDKNTIGEKTFIEFRATISHTELIKETTTGESGGKIVNVQKSSDSITKFK